MAKTGIVPLPDTTFEQLEGGHCISMVGFDDVLQCFYCANSWGVKWGQKGYFTLPYAYVLNPELASDFCFTQFVF